MADLIVSLAFWEGENTRIGGITALYIYKRRWIVAGTSSGRLYVWKLLYNDNEKESNNSLPSSSNLKNVSPEDRLKLECVMLGHNQAITAITSTNVEAEEAFISVSIDGTVCLWSVSDGSCLAAAEKALKCMPTSMTVLPNQNLVAFAGHRTFIEIFSIKTFTVTSTFAAHQTWINCLVSCDLSRSPQQPYPVLISAGADGTIQFFSMKEGETEWETPLQTLCLEIDQPLSMSISSNFKLLLVISSQRWIIYTAKAGKEVMSVQCPDIGGWKGGVFTSLQTVIVWSKEGNGYVYNIPSTPHAVALSFVSHNSSQLALEKESPLGKSYTTFESKRAEEIKFEPVSSNPISNFRSALLSKLKVIDSKAEENQPSYICSSNPNEEEGDDTSNVFIDIVGFASTGVFVVGTELGKLSVWATPEKIPTASRVSPWAITKPESKKKTNFGLIGSPQSNPSVSDMPNTTASIVVEDHLLLVLGFQNGTMIVAPLPTVDMTKIRYQNAHKGSVTSLLSLPMGSKEVRVVSGGEDFEINVWSIKEKTTLHLLYKFHNHFGPIVSLFKPEVPVKNAGEASRWRDYFFSISKDKTIGLFSITNNNCQHVYGVHPSFISNVKWQMTQDYLVVECDDGSVSVWEMGTGRLEAMLYGETARELLECSDDLLPETNGESVELFSKSVHAFTIASQRDPSPIQLVFLNIRKLLNDFERVMKQSRRTASIDGTPVLFRDSSSSEGLNYGEHAIGSIGVVGKVPNGKGEAYDNNSLITASALSCTAFSIFTYFLPWGIKAELDDVMSGELHLSPPNPEVSFAVRGANGKITVLVPQTVPNSSDRWCRSDRLSALHTLSAVAYTKNLMSLEPFQVSTSQLLTYYCALLGDFLPNYALPSLPFLAKYWRDPFDDVMQAARSIFTSAAANMTPQARADLIQTTSQRLMEDEQRFVSVIVLAALGGQYPETLEINGVGEIITNELVRLLNTEDRENVALRIAASELIGRAFPIWHPYISSVEAIIRQLFVMSMLSDPPYLSTVSGQALMLIGIYDPKTFINSLGALIHDPQESPGKGIPGQHSQAIVCLGNLIRQDPVSLLPLLPRLVEIIVKSLDPHVPYMRDHCLSATTSVLHVLVKKYPMISFHQETQRMAVGTKEGPIIIYDLKTATKWWTLEEGNQQVTALNFSSNGRNLASYTMGDETIRIWSTYTAFLSILSPNPQCIRKFVVPKAKEKILSPLNLLECVSLKWTSDKVITLHRTWDGPLDLKL
eukprot:TRINITY_DN3461_c0_g1_i1.p1 TRINITY_DN3461_c0_g1~~TRINITY_DN3461_c0_g1_i1.p1  ORF type:complete len:1249 (-),score=384.08 TRINITY_DN3461_c0_g1_i1:37-3783(-)